MLQGMNKFIQGWMANVIVGVIAVCFVFWGVENYLMGSNTGQAVAKVGKVTITDREFEQRVMQQRRLIQQQMGDAKLSSDQVTAMRAAVLQQMIENVAVSQYLQKHGFGVSVPERDKFIAQQKDYQENGQFSNELFKRVADYMAGSVAAYLPQVSLQIMQQQLQAGVVGDSSFVLPNELKAAYELQHQTRDLQYAVLPVQPLLAQQQPTEQAIQQFYQAHQADFMQPARVKVNYIVLSQAELAKSIPVTTAQAEQYYKANNAKYLKDNKLTPFAEVRDSIIQTLKTQKAEAKYADLRGQLSDSLYANSDNLASAAELIGQDIQTSAWISKGADAKGIFKEPAVQKILYSADVIQDKLNSEPVELPNKTIVAVHLNAYEAAKPKSLAAVKADIVKALKLQMANAELAKQAQTKLAALQQGKPAADLQWKQGAGVSMQSKAVPAAVNQAAFQLHMRDTKGQFSAITLPNGDYALVQLKAVHMPNFAAATAKDKQDLTQMLNNMQANVSYALFVKSVLDQTKVKRYELSKSAGA